MLLIILVETDENYCELNKRYNFKFTIYRSLRTLEPKPVYYSINTTVWLCRSRLRDKWTTPVGVWPVIRTYSIENTDILAALDTEHFKAIGYYAQFPGSILL